MITTARLKEKYGIPTQTGSKYLELIELPYPMRLAWDKDVTVNKMRCHKLVSANFKKVFEELLAYYGLEELQRLRIDLFGGCFSFRKMRNGNDWSRHSWGVAIDLDPEKNSLKATKKTASFAKADYEPMMEIFYRNGFVNLGKEKNYDFMHFEIKE
jgi:hypothetical protein